MAFTSELRLGGGFGQDTTRKTNCRLVAHRPVDPEELLANPFTPPATPLLNGPVFRGTPAQSCRTGGRLWSLALAFVLANGLAFGPALLAAVGLVACGGPTRVRLVLRVEDERFRPDYVEVVWGPPDGPQRSARIPATGSLPAAGAEIGTVLITLSDTKPGARRFVARGFRGERERVSGASNLLGWQGEAESTLTLTLVDCYDDPGLPKLPGCPTTEDGGVSDGGVSDAASDAGSGDAPVDSRPGDARDAVNDVTGDRPKG